MKFNEKEIQTACGAEVLKGLGCEDKFVISTDTRTIKEGEIYLPLKGETFDGEKFIEQALEKGAAGYFTTSGEVFENSKVVFKVENTLTAYLRLARYFRRKVNPKTVAITGSSGKTTTKEMVYAVLSQKLKLKKLFQITITKSALPDNSQNAGRHRSFDCRNGNARTWRN